MANNPLSGLGYFLAGFGLITQRGVRHLVLVPLLFNTLLFILLLGFGYHQFQDLLQTVQGALPAWLSWLHWLLWPLFVLAAVMLVMFGFSVGANFVAAPFNGLLAEAVERHLSGSLPENPDERVNWRRVLAELLPALWDEARKVLYYCLWLLPLLLFLIPPFNLVFPLLWFLFSAWMLALGYADFPLGNHHLKFKQQRALLKRKRMLVLGFGCAGLAATLVPLLNLLAMPAAVAGATKMYLGDFAGLPDAGK